jgi:spore maturation protein CgeB
MRSLARPPMRIVYLTHSLASCWNHGNAHFLRGVLRSLIAAGHRVEVYEPAGAWSLENLLRDHGPSGLEPFRAAYPELSSQTFASPAEAVERAAGADLVLVHEWNEPALIAALGRARARGESRLLLFHDTHHRAVSAAHEMAAFDLSAYDGVLAFGEALAQVYCRLGWGARAFVWHEAADTVLFRPPAEPVARSGLVWIGNWGDGERTQELETFLFRPARAAGLPLDVYGVRYPDEALATLARYGARYHGWVANGAAPALFARALASVHVPRRFYAGQLPGIPTIRVFEALACGIPLICAPWEDAEGLFTPGSDYLVAATGAAMERHMRALKEDPDLRAALGRQGLATIRARHTCRHRAEELLAIAQRLRAPELVEASP